MKDMLKENNSVSILNTKNVKTSVSKVSTDERTQEICVHGVEDEGMMRKI